MKKVMSKLTPEEVIQKQNEMLKESIKNEIQFKEDIENAIEEIEDFNREIQSGIMKNFGKLNRKPLKNLHEKYSK